MTRCVQRTGSRILKLQKLPPSFHLLLKEHAPHAKAESANSGLETRTCVQQRTIPDELGREAFAVAMRLDQRAEAVLTVTLDPKYGRAARCAQPLMAVGHEEVCAKLLQVYWQLPKRMGTIDQHLQTRAPAMCSCCLSRQAWTANPSCAHA